MTAKWLISGLALLAGGAQASTVYLYNFTGTAGSDTENASAQFTISNCTAGSCQLDILITNNITSPNDAGQGIIGLSFNIASLTSFSGSLNSTISNGSGGGVPQIDLPSGSLISTVTSAPEWTFGYGAVSSGCINASNVFCLDGHSLSGAPHDTIIGASATGGNASVGNFNPYLSGPVDFQINNFAGISLTSVLSNVTMDFGTNPDGTVTGSLCTTNCGGGVQSLTPEPFSFVLVGSGLALLGLKRLRRR